MPRPSFRFPKLALGMSKHVEEMGGQFLGVLVGHNIVSRAVHATLAKQLEELGNSRPDSPMSMYHNIIDPNIGAFDGKWILTEFEVKERLTAEVLRPVEDAANRSSKAVACPWELINRIHERAGGSKYASCSIASRIPDLDPRRYAELYITIEHVLEVAMPLLARLRLPSLLLPGPLQAVVKAQCIVLEDGDVYEGIWHEDGLREHVVAVVLYYYGISTSLEGGDPNVQLVARMISSPRT